jgi:hypothetical protein
MERAAKDARNKLSDLQSKYKYEVVDPVKAKEAQDKVEQDFVNSWRPVIMPITENFKSIKVGGKDSPYEIPIREEDGKIAQQVFSEISDYLFSAGKKVSDENIAELKSLMKTRYIQLNEAYVFQKVGEIARAMEASEWNKLIHNSKPLKSSTEHKEVTLTPQDAYFEKVKNEK